jgi:hypothetical protein
VVDVGQLLASSQRRACPVSDAASRVSTADSFWIRLDDQFSENSLKLPEALPTYTGSFDSVRLSPYFAQDDRVRVGMTV